MEVETRALEVREQENAYWRDYYEAVHNSRLRELLDGDLDAVFALSEKTRRELMSSLTPEMIKEHVQRCLDVRHGPLRPQWSCCGRSGRSGAACCFPTRQPPRARRCSRRTASPPAR